MDRRFFLKSGGIALASIGFMAAAPDALQQFANAQTLRNTRSKRKILITIFQRCVVDGLNMVVPFGDTGYYDARRNIAIQKPGKTDGPSTSMDFSGFIHRLRPLNRFGNPNNWPSSIPPDRRTTPDRTSMRRITWSQETPATKARATVG